jgi:hypothetical protein
MSSGEFSNSKYESNSGRVYFAKVQPETLALDIGGSTNDAPAGAIDQEVSAKMNGSRREIGVNARSVSLSWTASPPTGYDANGVVRVPIMTPTFFDSITRGATGTYLGAAVEVVGKSPEAVN